MLITKKSAILTGLLAMAIFMAGCQATPAQKGALGGAAVGGIAGQLIGRDTKSTLIGAGVGGLTGALLNDHIDGQKRQAYEQGHYHGQVQQQQQQQQQPSYNTAPR